MCMFSASVESVKNTKIFARLSGTGTQFLVYSMTYAAERELSMILPLPVGSHDENTALRFISLENYSEFFEHMMMGFRRLTPRAKWLHGGMPRGKQTLTVHQIGAYEASFAPSLADFDRLDARFKLPNLIWDKLPQYRDYGFAVFKLRATERDSVAVHPMAFEFVTRFPNALFFPTVHVHDGRVRDRAEFDHYLFYQGDNICHPNEKIGEPGDRFVFTSQDRAVRFVRVQKTKGIVDGEQPCWVVAKYGMLPNQDTLLVRATNS